MEKEREEREREKVKAAQEKNKKGGKDSGKVRVCVLIIFVRSKLARKNAHSAECVHCAQASEDAARVLTAWPRGARTTHVPSRIHPSHTGKILLCFREERGLSRRREKSGRRSGERSRRPSAPTTRG